ncbi:hypothetical protein LUZ60_002261 [Juncus effusus]|nr:hypothetical protein LUZ60_002261 [Juncus effusus]
MCNLRWIHFIVLRYQTMGGLFSSAIVDEVVNKGSVFVTSSCERSLGVDEKLERLQQQVLKIHSVVEEAENRQITNHWLLLWLRLLMEMMYQGDYVLDVFKYRALLEPSKETGDDSNSSYVYSPYNQAKRVRIVANMAKILLMGDKDINELSNILNKLEIVSPEVREFMMLLRDCRPLHKPATVSNFYMNDRLFGRHVEMEEIINCLLCQPDTGISANLGILPVIGFDGVGKTTLVLHVYNDPRVRSSFPLTIWLHVKFIRDVVEFTRDLLNEIEYNFSSDECCATDSAERLLKEALTSQRFLLVLDDVNYVDEAVWNSIQAWLNCVRKRSMIIITSSKNEVAKLGNIKPIRLKGFSKEKQWFFFKEYAFGNADPEEFPVLAKIGQQIAKRIDGSPWAARILGEQLQNNLDTDFWNQVLNNDIWEIKCMKNSMRSVAELILQLVPLRLELCSINCSHSLDGTEIGLADLIKTPRANRIAHKNENSTVESDQFRVLIAKSISKPISIYYTFECRAI